MLQRPGYLLPAPGFRSLQSNLQAEWQATSHISVNAAYVQFVTKGFLKVAGAKDIDFLGLGVNKL